jgi:putative transposase
MAAAELATVVGIVAACAALAVSRASWYRLHRPRPKPPATARPSPPRALSANERQEVLDVLHSERFVDQAPAEVFATLLDEERYLCSERTMYRVMAVNKEGRERRNQLTHPEYKKPELIANGPNQVWSWDITKLRGPVKWSWFYLYAIIDIFSRYVVGWMVAERENAAHARRLIAQTCEKHGVVDTDLILHSDRGVPMTAKTTAQLLADMGVNRSLSRPHVSDDNPFSEAQFKTLKYHPSFPGRFGVIEDATAFCRSLFRWYNTEHRHAGIAMLTPEVVHYGQADEVLARRRAVLEAAYHRHPERFVRRMPAPLSLPTEVWINPPPRHHRSDGELH